MCSRGLSTGSATIQLLLHRHSAYRGLAQWDHADQTAIARLLGTMPIHHCTSRKLVNLVLCVKQ